MGDHGIDDADECFLIAIGELLGNAKAFKQPKMMERSGVGGAASEQVIHRHAEELGQEDELVRWRRVEAHFVFVELRGVNAELSGNFLLGKILLFAQYF